MFDAEARAREAPLRLLADCGGTIEEIAVTIPPVLIHEPRRSAALSAIGAVLKAQSADASVQVLTAASVAALVQDWLRGLSVACNVNVVEVPDATRIPPTAIWTQDSFLMSSRGPLWPRSDNLFGHAEFLSLHGISAMRCPDIHLSGGNCLVGPDFWLVGADSVRFTDQQLRTLGRTEDALSRFEQFDGRRLHIVGIPRADGRLAQPDFHIDRFMSVTGLNDDQGKPIVLVAREMRLHRQTWGHSLGDALDRIADRLEQDGFNVLRNPVPNRPLPGTIDWQLRCYNNVLVENGVAPRVFMPCFGDQEPELAQHDEINAAIWRGLGFDVCRVHGWTALAPMGGALRCATKVLRRAPDHSVFAGQAAGNSAHLPGRNATRDLVVAG